MTVEFNTASGFDFSKEEHNILDLTKMVLAGEVNVDFNIHIPSPQSQEDR